jgi:phage gpG-like protein
MTRFERALRKIRDQAGVLAVNHTKKAFRDQGFTDSSIEPWKNRKAPKGKNANKKSSKRAILVKSGLLKRSVRVTRSTGTDIAIGSDLPYAQVHNEGLRAGRGKGFIMPKRQFIGDSLLLENQIAIMAEKEILNLFI